MVKIIIAHRRHHSLNGAVGNGECDFLLCMHLPARVIFSLCMCNSPGMLKILLSLSEREIERERGEREEGRAE